MANNYFSDELAFGIARFPAYEKGKEYYEDGCVEKVWKEEKTYKAIVKGTQSYDVSLRLEGEELKYDCSCPYELGGGCKHVVAAILALAADKKLAVGFPAKTDENKQVVEGLLAKTTENQLKMFLKNVLRKQPELIGDLKVFLQGKKQTSITAGDYKNKFRNELDQLDLKELLQGWFAEGEDYYDGDYGYGDFATASLSDIVDEFISEGKKYEENNNFGEALKIYQAIFEALREKEKTLPENVSDLEDCFDREEEKAIDCYIKILTNSNNDDLKNIGVAYLCNLFQIQPVDFQDKILSGLKQVIVRKNEAIYALELLKRISGKSILSISESSLLAFLYFLAENPEKFESLSLKNLNKNPGLASDLLKYYQINNHRDKIIQASDQVLKILMRKDSSDDEFIYSEPRLDYKEIEIRIRRFLKDIYSSSEDYQMMISNLERLFLITGSLSDYKELANKYRTIAEKESFWLAMKKYFDGKYQVKNIFNVFKFEDQKQEILNLIRKYPDIECFSEMISSIQDDFPGECFLEYKKKIQELLKKTDVEKYKEAVHHLKRMQKIGLEKEFGDFINKIKTDFWRRRRLMEELRENQL